MEEALDCERREGESTEANGVADRWRSFFEEELDRINGIVVDVSLGVWKNFPRVELDHLK